jgi:hypothetical protein
MIEFRAASLDDVPELRDLVVSAYRHYVPRIGLEPAPMGADYAELVRAGRVTVAMENSAIVGLIVLVPDEVGGDHLLVENIAGPARRATAWDIT